MAPMTAMEARDDFAAVVNRAAFGKERVLLTRRGRELAAVVPVEDVVLLEALEAYLDVAAAHEALASPAEGEPRAYSVGASQGRVRAVGPGALLPCRVSAFSYAGVGETAAACAAAHCTAHRCIAN